MKFFLAGMSYKTAPVEFRERLAMPASRLRCCGCQMKLSGGVSELVILSTCNRVEIYGTASNVNGAVPQLFQQLSGGTVDVAPYVYVKEGNEAVRHLFAVTSGLDSMVVGETEITGQVKSAYQQAQEAGLTGRVLNQVFQHALRVAKEIRTKTGIGRGATSVGSVAVELAERIFDRDLSDKTVLIVGAGKMGEACVRHLSKKGARSVLVANRSVERAQALAADVGGRAIGFDRWTGALAEADIVVSSTGCPHTILHRADIDRVMPSRRNRPLVLIDIAVPRNIDPDVQQLENVYLYDVDDLQMVVRENLRQREEELARCEGILNAHVRAVERRISESRGTVKPAAHTPRPGSSFWNAQPLAGGPLGPQPGFRLATF